MKNHRIPLSLSPVSIGSIDGTEIVYSNLMPFLEGAVQGTLNPCAEYYVSVGWYALFAENGNYTKSIRKAKSTGINFTTLLNSPKEFSAFVHRFPDLPAALISELYFFYIRHNYGRTFDLVENPKSKDYKAVMVARRSGYKNRDLAKLIPDLASIIPSGFNHPEKDVPNSKYLNDRRLNHSEISDIFNRSKMGLILSFCEGANRTTIEYLLSGLPVLSTKCVGGRELFLDNSNSIIVPRQDDREEMRHDIQTGFEELNRNLSSGKIQPKEIRISALQRLRWFHDRFVDTVALSLNRQKSEIRIKLNHLLLEHSDSFSHVLKQPPLEPVGIPKDLDVIAPKLTQQRERHLKLSLLHNTSTRNNCSPQLLRKKINSESPLPFSTHEFDHVFASNILEELNWKNGTHFLKEAFRILSPGGKLEITTIDFKSVQEILTSLTNEDKITGDVSDSKLSTSYYTNLIFRRWNFIYDFNLVRTALEAAGFTSINQVSNHKTPLLRFLGPDQTLKHFRKEKINIFMVRAEKL